MKNKLLMGLIGLGLLLPLGVNAESTTLLGDVNLDGQVDTNDTDFLFKYVSGYQGYELTEQGMLNADVYEDGKISNKDVSILTKYLNNTEGYETLPILPSKVLFGDVNEDGSVNEQDYDFLSKYVDKYEGYELTEQGTLNADLNEDDTVNLLDVTILARHLEGWEDYLELPYLGDLTIYDEVNNTANATVTVGEVETPVYNVEISWNSFKFDWKYNYETKKYEWQVGVEWNSIPLEDTSDFNENTFNELKNDICLDSECSTIISKDTTYDEVSANIEQYYYRKGVSQNTNHFHIGDYSTGGQIIPSVKWTPAEGYEYVEGKFSYTENEGNTSITLENDEIPENGRNYINSAYWYHLNLYLTNKEEPTTTPTIGDTIGTVTITIKAAE